MALMDGKGKWLRLSNTKIIIKKRGWGERTSEQFQIDEVSFPNTPNDHASRPSRLPAQVDGSTVHLLFIPTAFFPILSTTHLDSLAIVIRIYRGYGLLFYLFESAGDSQRTTYSRPSNETYNGRETTCVCRREVGTFETE